MKPMHLIRKSTFQNYFLASAWKFQICGQLHASLDDRLDDGLDLADALHWDGLLNWDVDVFGDFNLSKKCNILIVFDTQRKFWNEIGFWMIRMCLHFAYIFFVNNIFDNLFDDLGARHLHDLLDNTGHLRYSTRRKLASNFVKFRLNCLMFAWNRCYKS